MVDSLEERRRKLVEMLAALEEKADLGAEDRGIVTLDQQSVGRLSRMDALQRQAMASANARRRETERSRFRAALARLDDGEYGYCRSCGEEIAIERLDLDPSAALCISCARG